MGHAPMIDQHNGYVRRDLPGVPQEWVEALVVGLCGQHSNLLRPDLVPRLSELLGSDP